MNLTDYNYNNNNNNNNGNNYDNLSFMLNNIALVVNLSQNQNQSLLNVVKAGTNPFDNFQFSFQNIVLAVFLISLGLLTVLGNTFVLLAIFLDFHLRSPTHYLMGSLALADLLLGTLVLPFSSFQLYFDSWPFGDRFCEIWLTTDVLCCTASIYLVLVISIDRYIGITRPLKYNMIMTKRRMYLIIIFVWTLSLVVSLAPQIGWKSPQASNKICEVNEDMAYALFSASLSFYIPLLIILIVYYRIFKEARAQSKFLKTGIKTSKTPDGNNAVTLRVHIGPSSSSKKHICMCNAANMSANSSVKKQTNPHSSCNNNNGHSIKMVKRNAKYTRKKPFLNPENSQNLFEIVSDDELNNDSQIHTISLKEPFSNDSNRSINTNNNNSNNGNVSKSNSTFYCKNCASVNNLSNSSGLLLNKVAKFKSEQKAAKTLAIVVGCFTICWLPFFLVLPIESFKLCPITGVLLRIFFWLGYCNSAMNPLIYALSSREFRRAYKRIIKCNLKYRNREIQRKFVSQKFKTNLKMSPISMNE